MDALGRVRKLPYLRSTADAKQGSEITCGSRYREDDHFNADEAKEILDSLLQNKELETLVMDGNRNFGSLESCRALGELLRTSTTLKHLSLREVEICDEGLKFIVEGILDNSQSALEALDLGWNNLTLHHVNGNVVANEVDEGTAQSTNPVDSLESWRALGKLVRTSTTLKHLSLRGVEMRNEGLKLIVEGILENSQSAFEALDLGWNKLTLHHGDGNVVANEVDEGTAQSTDPVDSLESWRALGKLVRTSTTLKHLLLSNVGIHGKHLKHIVIVEGINNSQSALETLDLSGNEDLGSGRTKRDDNTYVGEGAKQLTDLLLDNTRALATLDMKYIMFSAGEMKSMGKALASNTTLINLTLGFPFEEPGRELPKILFDSLKSNKSLQKADLYVDRGTVNDVFEYLMEIFRVNYTILEMPGLMEQLRSERRSQLEGMLLRNRRLGEYINTLQEKLQFVRPNIGRLFLCGSPFAGKTSLRTSMVGTQAGWIRKTMSKAVTIFQRVHFLKRPNERTQGIEIQSLKTPKGQQIALWDMAGQEEYRALHDNHYLFPEMSQACIFLFVFRPLEEEGRCNIDGVTLRRFKRELHYWLSFINSNSRKAEAITPGVTIVLTHLDKLFNIKAESYVAWAKDTVEEMRKSFKGQVEVDGKIHAVNSHSPKDALLVVNEVMTIMDDLFPKLPKVPAACEKVNLMLTKWARDHKTEPIITSNKFFELCRDEVPELKDLFRIDPKVVPKDLQASASRSREAVVKYLHDSGCIINFQGSEHILVDINWLGQTFLGQLFNRQNEIMQQMIPPTKDGIVSKGQLENYLWKFIEDGKYAGITAEVLVELMKALKVCEDASLSGATAYPQYFMPCTLDGVQGDTQIGRRQLKWTEMVHDYGCSPVYTGLRLQCKDPTRTFLSPGLFLRYQVHLLTKLSGQSSLEYKLERNLIYVKHSGVEMFIETSGKLENPQYGGDDDYVDILMKYYDQSMSGKQNKYPYGISELRTFCASREGCPGVFLEEAILRPACVEKLTPCIYRRKQAVSREELKKEMEAKLFSEIGASSEIWNEGGYADAEDLFDSKIYRHGFAAVHDHDQKLLLEPEWVNATTLLDDLTDIENAIVRYRQSAESEVRAISQAANDVHSVVTNSATSAISQASTSSSMVEITSSAVLDNYRTIRGPSDDYEDEHRPAEVRDILRLGREFKNHIDRKHDAILEAMKSQLKAVQQLHQKRQTALMEKIDQVLVVSQARAQSHMPKIPYFTTDDVNVKERIISAIQLGTAFRLHFMCEGPSQVHTVKDQEGFSINSLKQGELAKKLRPLISVSMKVVYILLKAGLHVGAGIGGALPDFSHMGEAIPLTAGSLAGELILSQIKMTNPQEVDHDIENAWQCLLYDIMEPLRQQGRISQIFKLYPVQYTPNSLTKHLSTSRYWVCSDCRGEANRAGQLVSDY